MEEQKSIQTPVAKTRMESQVKARKDGEIRSISLEREQKENVEGSKEKGKIGEVQEGSELGNMEWECSEVEGNKKIEEGEITGGEKVAREKVGRSPISQSLKYGQVTIATPSRFAALRNTDEKLEEIEEEQIEELEEMDKEEEVEVEDIYQSRVEENVEVNKKGRGRQILPRQSKTNHKVVIPKTSDHVKDMRRGTRKNH